MIGNEAMHLASFLTHPRKGGASSMAQDNLARPLKSIGAAPSPTILHQIGILNGKISKL